MTATEHDRAGKLSAGPTSDPGTLTVAGLVAELVAELHALVDLPPIEQARACPGLIERAKSNLSRARGAALLAAKETDPEPSNAMLGRELHIHPATIGTVLAAARAAREAAKPSPEAGTTD